MFRCLSALLPTRRHLKRWTRSPGWRTGWGMKKRRARYEFRKQTVEPVFGIIKRVMG